MPIVNVFIFFLTCKKFSAKFKHVWQLILKEVGFKLDTGTGF